MEESENITINEVEVEVIESSTSYYKELASLVGIKKEIDNSRQIIINGIPTPSIVFLIHCPKCGRVIHVLDQPGMTPILAREVCKVNTQSLTEIAQYCPKCGQKLRYDFDDVIDASYTNVTEETSVENN